ncbi:hypothetical protein WS54_06300 [Burkholderia sp. NRF60-BP8]|nr:hypothetical protein WS54_06300 [Burkholderia sp. NRF60-BP8]KVA07281.1 hypothetical protein WS54_24305 [Burkholderia sp. NRF60-BP8]
MARDADVPGGVRARGPSGLFRYRDAVVVMAAAVVLRARHPGAPPVSNTLAARPAKANEAISIRISRDAEEGLQAEWGGANARGRAPCPFDVWATQTSAADRQRVVASMACRSGRFGLAFQDRERPAAIRRRQVAAVFL